MKVSQCLDCGTLVSSTSIRRYCDGCKRTRNNTQKRAKRKAGRPTFPRQAPRTAFMEVVKDAPGRYSIVICHRDDIKNFATRESREEAITDAKIWAKRFGWNPSDTVDVMC